MLEWLFGLMEWLFGLIEWFNYFRSSVITQLIGILILSLSCIYYIRITKRSFSPAVNQTQGKELNEKEKRKQARLAEKRKEWIRDEARERKKQSAIQAEQDLKRKEEQEAREAQEDEELEFYFMLYELDRREFLEKKNKKSSNPFDIPFIKFKF